MKKVKLFGLLTVPLVVFGFYYIFNGKNRKGN